LKFVVKCSIHFHDERGLKLEEPISYLIDNTNIKISSIDSNKMEVEIILDHEDKDEVLLILNDIVNLISFYENIPIRSYGISGIQKFDNTGGKKSIVISNTVRITEKVVIVKTTKGKELKDNLTKGISDPDFQSDIALYREAINENNSIAKYILLYRLFDSLFNSKLTDINDWIISEESNVQQFYDRKRGNHTIYTYIRDSIAHPKNKKVSISNLKVGNYVSKLQNYVMKRIKEKYQI